jgi:hypothetical protein
MRFKAVEDKCRVGFTLQQIIQFVLEIYSSLWGMTNIARGVKKPANFLNVDGTKSKFIDEGFRGWIHEIIDGQWKHLNNVLVKCSLCQKVSVLPIRMSS